MTRPKVDKRRTWNSFIKTRNPAILLKYKNLVIIFVITHITFKKRTEQDRISMKTNPKKCWNYVNSKFKNKNIIGNLTFINSLGKEEITSNDTIKTEILNSFFSSVFVKEDNTNFTPLQNLSNVLSMGNLVIYELDILKNWDTTVINKSPGLDGIHPRILYEVRDEMAGVLKIIFINSLQNHEVPGDWRAGNISSIFKKR